MVRMELYLRSSHRRHDADILIAATALEHGLVIATGNVTHFGRIPGLQVVNWRELP